MPPRIVAVLEGESLVNDASGLMLCRLAIAATLTGAFSWLDAVATFGKLAVGGIMVGLAVGYLVTEAFARMRDTASVILLSFLVSWGAYIGAEALHVSGVLAVVTVGLMLGWRQHSFLSAHNRVQARAVWELHTSPENAGMKSVQRIMLAASGPKPIGEADEVLLVDRLQHPHDGLLDDLVLQAPDAQGPPRSVRLRNVGPSGRPGTIAALVYPLVQILQLRFEIFPVGPPRHAVDP